jgi:hypothetical protein
VAVLRATPYSDLLVLNPDHFDEGAAMSWGTPDWYYQPEAFDLKTVGEIEWSNEAYQFDLTVVWLHLPTGRYLVASDAGCSCPSPFESFTQPVKEGDLYDTPEALQFALYRELEDRAADSWNGVAGRTVALSQEITRLVQEARLARPVSTDELAEVFGPAARLIGLDPGF